MKDTAATLFRVESPILLARQLVMSTEGAWLQRGDSMRIFFGTVSLLLVQAQRLLRWRPRLSWVSACRPL
jgi:hypothetical protein